MDLGLTDVQLTRRTARVKATRDLERTIEATIARTKSLRGCPLRRFTHAELLHEEETLESDFETRTAFLKREIASLDAAKAEELLARETGRPYLSFVEETRRSGDHLTLREEQILGELAPAVVGWPAELYDALTERKEQSRDLYAFALLRLVRGRTQLARLRGFPDAASEVYAGSNLERADSRRLLDAVATAKDVFVAFQKERNKRSEQPSPRYSFDDARQHLLSALEPFGARYTHEMASLLDPANGRIDIAPGEHRLRRGFSKGFPA